MLSGDRAVVVDVHAAGVSFPEVLQTPRRVPAQAAAPVRARQRGGRRGAERARRRGREGGRPRGRLLHARRLRRGGHRPRVPHLPAVRRARLRAGRRADPQLPHRLVLAGDPRPPRRGRDRARARRRRRRRHGLDPGGQGPRRAHDRRGLERRQGGRGARLPAPTRWCAPTGRGRTRPRSSPAAAWTWCSTRWAAIASPTACAPSREGGRLVVVGFTGGSIPEVQGQPAAPQQHRGGGRRLGRLRDEQAEPEPGDRRGA